MKCPSCGAEDQKGKFCAECGAGLDANCPSCGAAVPPGAQYCTACGEPVAAGAGSRGLGSRAGWIIAAVAVAVVLLVLFLPDDTERVRAPMSGSAPAAAPGAPAGGAGGMGGLSADMRTNADRLFNRIMMAAEQGNQAEVDQFMPMAVQAYGMVEELDDDGIYHLAILQRTAGELDQARQTAGRILDASPDHLLALGVAADAAEAAGDTDAANALWQRLLDAYAAEAGKPLPEYMDHQAMITEYRRMAREAVGQTD
ncbi:MAG: zinc ribbon domain-containing protein [Gemmatimonadota bacterium]|jgi:hypothetical protein